MFHALVRSLFFWKFIHIVSKIQRHTLEKLYVLGEQKQKTRESEIEMEVLLWTKIET